MKRTYFSSSLLILCSLLIPPAAGAQETRALEDVQIERDAASLRDRIADARVPDRDSADTALIFTNASYRPTRVWCRAFDADGQIVGRVWTAVPGLGLRYVLASDLAFGRDFVGSARCGTEGHVIGTAVFLARGAVTDLQVVQGDPSGPTRLRFPVVATY